MVYALLSIGVLGFIVWSQKRLSIYETSVSGIVVKRRANMMAHPCCEIWLNNLALYWNNLTLTGTFYFLNKASYNPVNYIKSVGSPYIFDLKISSETRRKISLINIIIFIIYLKASSCYTRTLSKDMRIKLENVILSKLGTNSIVTLSILGPKGIGNSLLKKVDAKLCNSS